MARSRRTGIGGKSAIRKMLRALPDEARADIEQELETGGRQILAAQRASARRKTGKMAAGLRMRLAKRSLTLKIGIIGKVSARKLFYARIIGGGRKAQTVQVTRRANTRPYALRVKARAKEPVIDPPQAKAVRRRLIDRLQDTWKRVIAQHPPGGTDAD